MKKIFILSVSIFSFYFMQGMELPRPFPSNRLVSNTDEEKIINLLHHDLDHMTSGSIMAQQFILSKHDTIEKLEAAKKRGISISIILDGSRSENKKIENRLNKAGIHVALFNPGKRKLTHLHSKTVLLKGLIDGEETAKLYFGSTNLSNMAYVNKEISLITSADDDEELLDQLEATHRRILEYLQTQQLDQASPLKVTPQKRRHISDLDRSVLDSQIMRIRNARPNAHIDIISMNINDENLKQEILQALDRHVTFRLFINKSSVNTKNRPFLDELQGSDGVEIYVFSSDLKINGKFNPIQHAKLLIRRQLNAEGEPHTLIGIGSANFTREARNDLNELMLIPNDPEIYGQAIEFADRLMKESVPYSQHEEKIEPLEF